MKPIIRIGLVGDRREDVRAHDAIPKALSFAGERAGVSVHPTWFPTRELERDGPQNLASLDAVWCVPGSPYASMEGALVGIRYAREQKLPFLGTCGGFQHAVIEFARNVAGFAAAEHAESSPGAEMLMVALLACPLDRVRSTVRLVPGSLLCAAYEANEATEEYQCRFGVNEVYREPLERAGLRFSALDATGDVRALELPGHPFFLGTLFQMELSALTGATHPVITAFVRAAAR